MSKTLAEVLNEQLMHRGWGFKKLALAAGLPRNTVYRWTKGEVRRVRHWQDLARTARTLALDRYQTNALLEAGGHPTIKVLLERATTEEERALLGRWALTPPNNLPNHLTSFVGRQEELAHITRQISSARLVTLTGPGGSGKTRLALEASQQALDDFDGVYLIDLAAVRDPELVITSIARTLGLGDSPDVLPLQSLVEHLRDRRVLLLLDNFEQVIEAAPLVTELLKATRRAKVLVTSRTRLHVRGEHELPVPPLPLPGMAGNLGELSRNPAVALFTDRARAVDAAFTLTPGNFSLVAAVCERLEGLPLGIELAAARTRQVGLRAMLERIPGRLALALGGPRDVPARQRTLRATIAWSYDLLEHGEQRLFTCLGVFVGGVTVAAAESVCAALGLQIEVPESLESLVEQNLLKRNPEDEDEPRYAMLESIREYALEKLAESGQEQRARRAHAGYYLNLAERADLEGNGQTSWLPRLEVEHDNVSAALGWCREQEQWETGLRLCIALMPLWQLRDHQLEARAWLKTFVRSEDTVPPALKASGLLWQGLLLLRGAGDVDAAFPHFEESLVLFRRAGDLDGASETLQAEGDAYRQQGAWGRASQQYVESLDLARQTGNTYLAAHGYMGLAFCAQENGPIDEAQRYWELTLRWAERSGNRPSIALALNSLGEMARYREEWGVAARYYEQALTFARELGSEFRIALALHNLGYVALNSGACEQAQALFTESLLRYERGQHAKGKAECLAGLGKVEAAAGRPERAARLCGASEAILTNLGTQLDTLDRADYVRTLATLGSELGERLAPLLAEGRAMSMASAVEYAVPDRFADHR